MKQGSYFVALLIVVTLFNLSGAVVLTSLSVPNKEKTTNFTGKVMSRKKRFLSGLFGNRQMSLPPHSLLLVTPALNLPFLRELPIGYGSTMSVSVPFKIAFDDLGLTSQNSFWGILPNLFRRKRDVPEKGNYAGGDRAIMYKVVEEILDSFGLSGRDCLMRAICEMHEMPLINHGFLGEILDLFLSPSRSPSAEDRLSAYVAAEDNGKKRNECWQYYEKCSKSFFTVNMEEFWKEIEREEIVPNETNNGELYKTNS